MSVAYLHTEWLSLLEISGPFLSLPVLLRALPQGLDARDPDDARTQPDNPTRTLIERLAFREFGYQ